MLMREDSVHRFSWSSLALIETCFYLCVASSLANFWKPPVNNSLDGWTRINILGGCFGASVEFLYDVSFWNSKHLGTISFCRGANPKKWFTAHSLVRLSEGHLGRISVPGSPPCPRRHPATETEKNRSIALRRLSFSMWSHLLNSGVFSPGRSADLGSDLFAWGCLLDIKFTHIV